MHKHVCYLSHKQQSSVGKHLLPSGQHLYSYKVDKPKTIHIPHYYYIIGIIQVEILVQDQALFCLVYCLTMSEAVRLQ